MNRPTLTELSGKLCGHGCGCKIGTCDYEDAKLKEAFDARSAETQARMRDADTRDRWLEIAAGARPIFASDWRNLRALLRRPG